ncbi:hypothetical protein MOU86_004649 [Vibrio parahaemolyticus]|nr:hypothetical protein [Vibrio parahaemolyticus]
MGALETVILGTVSGIFTTVVLYLVGLFFKHRFVPWYQSITYKGVDINGTWETSAVSGAGIHAKMEMAIRQNAHELDGSLTIVQGADPDKPTQVTNLNVSGHLWEGFLTLNMQSVDRTRLSFSTSLLQVLNGGLRLKGIYSFRSIQADEIESVEVTWKRKDQKKN